MNRNVAVLALIFAVVWASGALEVIHHLGECHHEEPPPPISAAIATGAPDGDPPDQPGMCALCTILESRTCCGHAVAPGVETAATLVDDPPELPGLSGPPALSTHIRGPPALLG